MFRGARVVPVSAIIVIWIATGLSMSLDRKFPPEGISGSIAIEAILFLSCIAGILTLMSARDDVRCVISARERKRLSVTPDRRALGAEITRRRRRWEMWVKEPHSLKFMLCLRSVAFRASVVAFFASGLCLELWRLHVARSASHRTVENTLGFVQGAMFVLMVAAGIWTWRRIKRTLANSLCGQVCPDCAYPIVAGEVVTTVPGMDVLIGPARCSECGCPWPLIPPQAFETA